jgi:riboflavin kinase/FMN adenylyltransferase
VLLAGVRVSSTAVREALAQGELSRAGQFLGRPYSISGRVVHGDKLGQELGYPTANIQMKHNKPPLSGIFAVELCGIDGGRLPGVASLGVRPTVKQNGAATLEVHVFDFHERIYGAHVRVDFLHKLRDEEKFPDLPTLIAQIARDVADAKDFFAARR